MILTVTLNPCVHHILAYEEPEDGRTVLKPVRSFFQPGGKGLNAARVVSNLGGEVLALTTFGDQEGRLLLREMAYSGVPVRAVEVSRPTRTSTCIYNMSSGAFMELLEPGVELGPEESAAYFDLLLEALPDRGILALCGSSPCRSMDDFFRRAVLAGREGGLQVVVDSYNAPLVRAIEAAPHMVKLNLHEIGSSFGMAAEREEDILAFARRLIRRGIEEVLVTGGARGAWLISRDGVHRFQGPRIEEVHAIGSGDAMLGALLARLQKGDNLLEACRWGVAAGAANAGRLEVCTLTEDLVEELLPSVVMESLERLHPRVDP
jgi:1-phosphofructokinase